MNYNKYFATEVYKFFLSNLSRNPDSLLSLNDYLKTVPDFSMPAGDGVERFDYSLAKYVSKLCKNLEENGYLIKVSQPSLIPITDKYIAVDKVNASNPEEFAKDIEYGCLDYKYQGFPFAYNHFKESVVPIVGINKKGNDDIGTAFYLGDGVYVTAAHCITGMNEFQLLNSDEKPIEIKDVWFAKDEDTEIFDIAVIRTNGSNEIKPFLTEEPKILSPVMVIGYPPIPGVDTVQTVETATVGGWITNQKSSMGEVVAPAESYMTKLDYFIITARVKGGNSGSPVINDNGKVIGIVVQIPLDNQGGYESGRYDIMGYGVCLPSKYINQLMDNPETINVKKNEQGYYQLT